MIERRKLFQLLGMAGTLLLGGFTMLGCNVFSELVTWIPVGLAALNSVVALLGPLVPPGAAAIILIIKAAFADLSAALTEYNSDVNPADKATLLAKIRTILTDITNNFQSFLTALNLGNNPIVTIVIGLVTIILDAIAGFMGQLPSTGTVTLTGSVNAGNMVRVVRPKLYKHTADFRADFNAECVKYGHPEGQI